MTPTQISAQYASGNAVGVTLEKVPDTCPLCHHGVQPMLLPARINTRGAVQVPFLCPRAACQGMFIGTYQLSYEGSVSAQRGAPAGAAFLERLEPRRPEPPKIPEEVGALSPTFVAIMGQVATAESYGLDQLVGIGLRKAVEFLVKDFAISENPADEQKIQDANLGSCIDSFIADASAKACAKRATWLGNDETHYTRKWEDKDVTNLKELVRLTVNWIDSHLVTMRYQKDMPDGREK